MRFIYAIAFALGLVVPLGWKTVPGLISGADDTSVKIRSNASGLPGTHESGRNRRNRNPSASPLEIAKKALARYDQSSDPMPWEERQLQRLMFTLEEEHLAEAIGLLATMEHPERFGGIARALFGRWAELDPLTACEAAVLTENFGAEPLRGAMLTWLTINEESALEWIGKRRPPQPELLHEWVHNYDPNHLAGNAKAIDALRALWPEAAEPLIRSLGERWVMNDWEGASAWIQSDNNQARRDSNLGRIARLRGESHGLDGLAMTESISSASIKDEARSNIFYWWAFESPHLAVQDMAESGIPLDWSGGDLWTFGNGLVGKHPEQLGEVLNLCQNPQQLESLCLGVLANRVLGKPAAITAAAIHLPDSAVSSGTGKSNFVRYYRDLSAASPETARQVFHEISPAKQDVVRHLLP